VKLIIRVMSHPIKRRSFTSNILQVPKGIMIMFFIKIIVNTLINIFSYIIRVMSHPIKRRSFTSNILQVHKQVVMTLLGVYVESFHNLISSVRAMSHQSTGYESPYFAL
jgi:hypothetical protein